MAKNFGERRKMREVVCGGFMCQQSKYNIKLVAWHLIIPLVVARVIECLIKLEEEYQYCGINLQCCKSHFSFEHFISSFKGVINGP